MGKFPRKLKRFRPVVFVSPRLFPFWRPPPRARLPFPFFPPTRLRPPLERSPPVKAILLNASPRKNRNTASLLAKVRDGLSDAGCETSFVHLGALDAFRPCITCLACKTPRSRCNGLCALRDSLRPVLEETLAADVLVLGSPVYFHAPTALARAFLERLLYPVLDYSPPVPASLLPRPIRSAVLFTMHVVSGALFDSLDYPTLLGAVPKALELLGPSEMLCFKGLSTFSETGHYNVDPAFRRLLSDIRRDTWPECERQAFDLGRRLASHT